MTSSPNSGLALSLAASSLISEEDSQRYLSQAKAQRKPFVTFLIENSILDSKALADFCELEYGVPLLDLAAFDLAEIPQKFLNQKLIDKHHVLPIYTQGHTLYIAMSDPTNVSALEDFGFSFGLHTEALLVEENKLTAAIAKLLENESDALGMEDIDESEISDLEVSDENSRLDESVNTADDDAPIVKYINKIMMDAIKRGASDLHFEPYEHQYRVRFRIDGELREVASTPPAIKDRLASRIKVLSKLDISEKRIPQDGRMKLKLGPERTIDLRVSTLPTVFGEKIVIRILDPSSAKMGIDALGYDPAEKERLLKAIHRPYGMILVTGPTGSGKTVSLYSCLNLLNQPGVNISTAEDPCEINMPGVNQVNVNDKAGLTFAVALRAFLRQDPDVIMVGEIRDLETADISVKAAQTGHLVLSTLHTNDAPTTLTRLRNMGVAPFNIASSVILISAQRLARRLCIKCKTPAEIPKVNLMEAGFTDGQLDGSWMPYKAVGCNACNNGYKGRVGIYQVMPISEAIQEIILADGSALDIAKQAELEGVLSLRQSGLRKVMQGITSLEEVLGVTNE